MLYIVYSPASDEQIVCDTPQKADRVVRNRTQALGFPWHIMPVTIPAGVSA